MQDVGSNFDKIAEMIETRNKTQVRAFYNTEVKRINSVLAPLGVQIDPSDAEEVSTAMDSWHDMKTRLAPGGSFQELCKRDHERNMFAWKFKNELDKSVFSEGKKEAKLKALGLIPAVGGDGAGKVIGVVPSTATKTTNRGRPKGSKNGCKSGSPAGRKGTTASGRKAARHGSASPSAAARSKSSKSADAAKEPKERLMLQLFPIDQATRAALVAGGFNPHLELTFRAKKSVFGLMQHLATKWDKAVPHLPASAGEPRSRAVLQLYPFEAASAAEAAGAWNAAHEGVTATDIFDACGRPAAFRVRYGWVPPAEAATRPHLPPPPPPVHQQSVRSRSRSRSGSGSPPESLSPRKRGADEMEVAHVARSDSFCQEPVQGGVFGGIFGGGHGMVPSIFGSDLAGAALFGAPVASGHPASRTDGDFTLSGFGDGDFSNMCREMGLDDPVASRGAGMAIGAMAGAAAGMTGMSGATGASQRAAGLESRGGDASAREGGAGARALASAAPGELKGYAQRQIISEFGGAGEGSITVGAMLENDGLFSLTQMLGDVPEGAAGAGTVAGPAAGPTNFAGMFGGPISEALGAIKSKSKPKPNGVNVGGGKGPGKGAKGAKGAPYLPPATLAAEPAAAAVAHPNAAYYPHQAPQGEGAQGVEGVLAAEAAEGSRGAHA